MEDFTDLDPDFVPENILIRTLNVSGHYGPWREILALKGNDLTSLREYLTFFRGKAPRLLATANPRIVLEAETEIQYWGNWQIYPDKFRETRPRQTEVCLNLNPNLHLTATLKPEDLDPC